MTTNTKTDGADDDPTGTVPAKNTPPAVTGRTSVGRTSFARTSVGRLSVGLVGELVRRPVALFGLVLLGTMVALILSRSNVVTAITVTATADAVEPVDRADVNEVLRDQIDGLSERFDMLRRLGEQPAGDEVADADEEVAGADEEQDGRLDSTWPDYTLTVRTSRSGPFSGEHEHSLGQKQNTSAVDGLTWAVNPPISRKDLELIELHDSDRASLDDLIASLSPSETVMMENGYRFELRTVFSPSTGIQSFFNTKLGTLIVSVIVIVLVLIIVLKALASGDLSF